MAIYPKNFDNKETLSPGARGERFQANIPGYRSDEDRINRTNLTLNTCAHDVPNIKYQLDIRLPVLFRYGFGVGYNQMVMPKGRIVAVDPYMDMLDHEMMHTYRANGDGTGSMAPQSFNTLTLANGGAPVRLKTAADVYGTSDLYSGEGAGQVAYNTGAEWMPLTSYDEAYDADTLSFRNLKTSGTQQLVDGGYEIDPASGKVAQGGVTTDAVRPGNIPVGIAMRNEYTRDDDAFNGIMPGAILTDCLVELPWFLFKDKAEKNVWGSAYGQLFPGALVKSDENGRFVVSPLSYMDRITDMSVAEYELERQQVIGQVYSTNKNLLPEGAARWATWALSDRRNFVDFNPDVDPKTNRRGEDVTAHTAYKTTGEYPGYPYEKTYGMHDLRMINSDRPYDTRMNDQYQYENLGIPGLTDGKNVVTRNYDFQTTGHLYYAPADAKYADIFMRVSEVDVTEMEIKLDDGTPVACVEGAPIEATDNTAGVAGTFMRVKFADAKQGIVVLEVTDKTMADEYLAAKAEGARQVNVAIRFKKLGLAGVPTFMDWDGCMGSVKILLTK